LSDSPTEKKGKIHTRRVPAHLKAKAKALYFEYYSISKIADETGLSASTIHHWVHGYRQRADRQDMPEEKTWKHQRQKREEELVQELADTNKRELHRIYRASLPLIADSLEALKNSVLDLEDAQRVTDIITKVDKLFRLSAEKPTEILGLSNLSLQEMKNVIESDYFRREPKTVKELISAGRREQQPTSGDPFPDVLPSGGIPAGREALSALERSGENGGESQRPGEDQEAASPDN
jgi:predicted transcriptional regulator